MNDETARGLQGIEMDIHALLEKFDGEVVNRGKAYYHEGRVLGLRELTSGKFKAFVAGTQSYNVTIELCPNGDAEYDCDCPYWNAPYCKHAAAALFAIAAGEYEKATDSQAPEDKLDPLSEEALGALPARRLAKLLFKIVRGYPETENWLRAELSERTDDIRAYKNLITDSIMSQMERGFVPYNCIHDALRGAWTAVDHLDELSHEDDFVHALEFAVMIITEVSQLSEYSDDDGDVCGVIARCMNWCEEMYENCICQESEAVQTEFFHCLIEWTRGSEMEDWWMPDTEPIEVCARIADTIPALRNEVMEFYSDKMNVTADESYCSWDYAVDNAQSKYHSMIVRWGSEEDAIQFAREHLNNDDLCMFLFEELIEREHYQEAITLGEQAEERADKCSRPHIVKEWKRRRYGVRSKGLSRRMLASILILSSMWNRECRIHHCRVKKCLSA